MATMLTRTSGTPVRPPRVCLLEDDPEIAGAMSDTLRDAGYEVETYDDARLALGSLRAQPADLILLDLRMPEMDGWQFRVAQRADSHISDIPVVIMTGDTSPQAAAIHADGSLNKPVSADDLIATVERVLRETKRRRFAASLEETGRLASLGTIASGVGHEANNPLASAMANLELMKDSLRSLSADLSALDGARSNAGVRDKIALLEDHLSEGREGLERVRLVVRNLQNVCRSLDDDQTQLDINQVVESAIAMAWDRVKSRAYVTRAYGVVPRIPGNEARLAQALMHLLINAAETIPSGRCLENSIRITTHRDTKHVVIEIKDTGRGVSDAMMGRVFNSSFTTLGRGDGTSLGLPMCRDILEEHDGQLAITSEPGGGTCFTIRLPYEADARIEPQHAPPSHTPSQITLVANEGPTQPRVWIVDDEPSVTRVIGRMLESGYELTYSESPTDVLLRLHAGESFDIMLCDVMMPEMTGAELAARIARDWPQLVQRIVFMSGGALTPTLHAFVTAPGRTFLEKPFTAAKLRDTVAETAALGARRAPLRVV